MLAVLMPVSEASLFGSGAYLTINIRNWIIGFKGWMNGFQRGFYDLDEYKLPEACLGTKEVNDKLVFIEDFVRGKRSIWTAYSFTTQFSSLFLEQFEACDYTGLVFTLEEFCDGVDYSEEGKELERCTMSNIIYNLYTRVFNFVSSWSRIWQGYVHVTSLRKWQQNETYLEALAIGRETGVMLRILFDFHLEGEESN